MGLEPESGLLARVPFTTRCFRRTEGGPRNRQPARGGDTGDRGSAKSQETEHLPLGSQLSPLHRLDEPSRGPSALALTF